MKLCDFVIREAILPDLPATSKEAAIAAMVSSLRATGSIQTNDEPSIVAAIMKREELGSTGIGNGVAVPHTKHPSVNKLIATVALTQGGVDFASLDGEAVHNVRVLERFSFLEVPEEDLERVLDGDAEVDGRPLKIARAGG